MMRRLFIASCLLPSLFSAAGVLAAEPAATDSSIVGTWTVKFNALGGIKLCMEFSDIDNRLMADGQWSDTGRWSQAGNYFAASVRKNQDLRYVTMALAGELKANGKRFVGTYSGSQDSYPYDFVEGSKITGKRSNCSVQPAKATHRREGPPRPKGKSGAGTWLVTFADLGGIARCMQLSQDEWRLELDGQYSDSGRWYESKKYFAATVLVDTGPSWTRLVFAGEFDGSRKSFEGAYTGVDWRGQSPDFLESSRISGERSSCQVRRGSSAQRVTSPR